MQYVRLDFRYISTRYAFYMQFAKQCCLPSYFGHNLDALWDVITSGEVTLPITIEFHYVPQKIPPWCQQVIDLFKDAQQQLAGQLYFEIFNAPLDQRPHLTNDKNKKIG